MKCSKIPLITFLIIANLIIFSKIQFAQINESGNITVASPEASTLGKYAMQPPDYSNGKPQVSIPIYTINEKDINFSLSLFYNSAGFKLNEESSEIGLGWGMSGGSITRIVKDLPDDDLNVNQRYEDLDYKNLNYVLGYGQYFDDPCYSSIGTAFNYTANRMYYNLLDGKPDIYIYNFGKYSGRFLYVDGNAYVFPYEDISIEKINGNFYITTPDGNKYSFTSTESSLTVRDHEFGLSADTYAPGSNDPNAYLTYSGSGATVSWRLTRIENPSNSRYISFTYQSYTNQETTDSWDFTSISFVGGTTSTTNSKYVTYSDEVPMTYTFSGHKYLTEIESNTAKMVLVYSSSRLDHPSAKALNSISIYSKSDLANPIKKITLDHGAYFGTDSNTETCYLKLHRVLFEDGDNEIEKKYDFEYYDETYGMTHSKKAFDIDHWGFFNGQTNESLVPKTDQIVTLEAIQNGPFSTLDLDNLVNFGWANRSPNFQNAQRYTLKKIVYPTGGYSEITYESAGGRGIRVASIEDNDGDNSIMKYYDYYPDDPVPTPTYKEEIYETSFCGSSNTCGGYDDEYTPKFYNITGYARKSLDYYDDNTNFYTKVTEFIGNSLGVGGKTEYYFERDQYSQKTFLQKEYFYKYGNQTPVKKISNIYDVTQYDYFKYFSDPVIFWKNYPTVCECYGVDQWQYCPRDILPALTYNLSGIEVYVYTHVLNKYNLASTTITEQGVEDSTCFNYNGSEHNFLSKKEQFASDGATISTYYKYPLDYNSGEENFSSLIINYIIGKPIDIRTYKGTSLISGTQNEYNNIGQITDIYNFESLATDEEFDAGNAYTFSHKYGLQYDNENLVNIIPDNNFNTVYLWDLTSTYVMAKIENATYNTALDAQNAVNSCSYNSKSFHTTLSGIVNGMITTYSYDPLVGMTSETGPDGRTTYYVYDDFGRLKYVKNHKGEILKKHEYNYVNK